MDVVNGFPLPPLQKMSFDELEKYLGKQAGVIMEWRKLQFDTNTSKRMQGEIN